MVKSVPFSKEIIPRKGFFCASTLMCFNRAKTWLSGTKQFVNGQGFVQCQENSFQTFLSCEVMRLAWFTCVITHTSVKKKKIPFYKLVRNITKNVKSLTTLSLESVFWWKPQFVFRDRMNNATCNRLFSDKFSANFPKGLFLAHDKLFTNQIACAWPQNNKLRWHFKTSGFWLHGTCAHIQAINSNC